MALNVFEHVDLQALNTLALPARARYFLRVETAAVLPEALAFAAQRQLPLLVLGGGSNLILRGDWQGLALLIAVPGKQLDDTGESWSVRIGAGENWHELVQWTLAHAAYGLENLTLIPGTAGAAPIQNIGAYGVELADCLESVRGWSIDAQCEQTLSAAQCQLGYRDSIFKHALAGRFIITEIGLRLRKQFAPVLTYPALREALQGKSKPDAAQVERAVRSIRQSKLPDPTTLPNAGSFFKNPVISATQLANLLALHPQMPHFAAGDGAKLPAAWLLDQCGWKGRRIGAVGVHEQQALVLVSYLEPPAQAGRADELLGLAEAIKDDVAARFGVTLELEPTVYGAG